MVNWANWYQSIYDMSAADRPPDNVIEDDAAIDTWSEKFVRDQERKAGKARGRNYEDDVNALPSYRPH